MRMLPATPYRTDSRAELKVFDLLKNAYADQPDWHLSALHSLNLPNHARKRFSEIDFVIVGRPGLFVLEVKGGGVACHGGIWTTTGGNGARETLRESPFHQAQTALHALCKRLKAQLGAEIVGQFPIGYGVLFPDCDWHRLGAEWDQAVLGDARALRNPQRWLGGLFRHWQQRHAQVHRRSAPVPSPPAIAAMVDCLRPEVEVAVALHAQVAEIAERVHALTADQRRLIDAVADNPRILCHGGAGTGKTFLALELARRWAADGAQVLLACQSPWLRHWLAARFAVPNLTVALSAKAAVAARRAGVERFDALIVDEGQDLLHLDRLEPLDHVLAGGLQQGRWCLFHDANNQAGLYGPAQPAALASLEGCGPARLRLTTNCRNTRQILELVRTRLGADMGVRGSGDGPAVRLLAARTAAEVTALLAAEIDWLTGPGGLPPSAITILSARPFSASAAARLPRPDAGALCVLDEYALRDFPPPAISFAEIVAFKGLENEAVIVIDLCPEQASALHYVGLSRARTCLTLITVE